MPFTDDNNLEIPTSGVADWDSPLSSNFTAMARGFSIKAVAGAAVNTGDAVSMVGSAYVVPHNSNSMDLATRPVGIARTSLGSGDAGQIDIMGIVRSLTVFSGNITPGQSCFINPSSVGMLTTSIAAAQWPIGIAVDQNAVLLRPGDSIFPTRFTTVVSVSAVLVGSQATFAMDVGAGGWVRKLQVVADSCDSYKVIFHSNSSRAAGERLFETLTTSVDGGAGDTDITSLNWTDAAGWGYECTNTASPSLIYGTILVQSASSVGSDDFSITIDVERFF